MIRTSASWFREVSGGRYSVSGVVTPWLRVRRPGSCLNGANNVGNQALAAAQRRGYRLGSFERFILVMPCRPPGGILGFAALPGRHVVLFSLGEIVVVHEQGHNLGLQHAGARQCVKGRRAVTWSRRCRVIEYGDAIDSMGNYRAGHYNSFYKARLRWLNSQTTVTRSRTVRLAPVERRGRGFKAIRLRAGRATYWLEYRTKTGADANIPTAGKGVQIRLQAGPRTQLLDLAPRSRVGVHPFDDANLAVGGAWTTPQGVRITVVAQGRTSAVVAFRFPRR